MVGIGENEGLKKAIWFETATVEIGKGRSVGIIKRLVTSIDNCIKVRKKHISKCQIVMQCSHQKQLNQDWGI